MRASIDEILQELVDVLDNGGALENKDEFLKVVKAREAISSTGLEEGIAIPHGKTKAVKKPAVAFGRSEGVDFNSLDGEPSKLFFMIAAPEDATDSHIETLSKLTDKLLDDEVREKRDCKICRIKRWLCGCCNSLSSRNCSYIYGSGFFSK